MAKKLFFGNLSYGTTDETLRSACEAYGVVSTATVIMDRMTNRSKGFGFVEMDSDDDAQKVIEALNGQEMDGRKIIVNEARPQEDRPRNNFSRGPRM